MALSNACPIDVGSFCPPLLKLSNGRYSCIYTIAIFDQTDLVKVFKTLFAMPAQLDSGGRFAWSINDDGPKSFTLVKVGPVMMASLSILKTMAIVVSRLVRGLIAVSRALKHCSNGDCVVYAAAERIARIVIDSDYKCALHLSGFR